MPSWNTSRTLRQQDEVSEMEMGSMHQAQAAPMLPKSPHAQVQEYPYQANAGAYGDVAASHGEQYGYGGYSPRVASPATAAPSYHTSAPAPARKPVGGSWRDV
ncbi:unnamed protein product [Aureobasidium vineae]|uniref:Uncharacterized protein n=1 Tax=Aureobasidium vineae TaxID=2773715 RepID=A0A9N8JRV4_9PEZI|nr:unnamed protein product [Aureobasidium vineae]